MDNPTPESESLHESECSEEVEDGVMRGIAVVVRAKVESRAAAQKYSSKWYLAACGNPEIALKCLEISKFARLL